MNDDDEEVRSASAQGFRDKQILTIPGGQELVLKYIKSKAYHDDPTPLFYILEEYAGSLLPYLKVILGICREFAGPLRDASRDVSTRTAADAYMIPPLLLRLYEQAESSGDIKAINQCLDAWDLLFENRVGLMGEISRRMFD